MGRKRDIAARNSTIFSPRLVKTERIKHRAFKVELYGEIGHRIKNGHIIPRQLAHKKLLWRTAVLFWGPGSHHVLMTLKSPSTVLLYSGLTSSKHVVVVE